MKIVITGVNGALSNMLSANLCKHHSITQISIRGNISSECIPDQTDYVVHIAGITPSNMKEPKDYETVNVDKTKLLYQICQEKNVKHFIYISSMSVYEGYFNKLIHKDINKKTPCMPLSPYARSKHNAEKVIISGYNDRMHYTIIRVPSLYDENKTEYFNAYKTLINLCPVVPVSPFAGKRSVLHTHNLCAVIQQLIDQPFTENRIILPQDAAPVTANMIIDKILKNQVKRKRKTYVGGLFLHLFSIVVPRYRGLFCSICYANDDSVLVSQASIENITL